jgi:Sec-independent protein translocase protein TatA
MGDVAKGIKSFKKGMSDEQSSDNKDPKDKDQNSKSNH